MANLNDTSNRRDFLKYAGVAGGSLLATHSAFGQSTERIAPLSAATWVNATEQGISPDGKTKNTTAINSLIKRLAAAGGGTLYFPPGTYHTGAIHLQSNITFYLDAGATIRFSEDFDDYLPMVPSRWQGNNVLNFSPLIYAHKAENISIIGQGTIDGSGAVWWDYVLKLRQEAKTNSAAGKKPPSSKWQEEAYRINEGNIVESYGFMRPSLLQVLECKNVLVQGVAFRDSPFWTTHFIESEDVVVDGISVHTPNSPNTDGINPESSRNVRISNCFINTDDDCITIKSGKDKWARKNASPCENVTITNCVMTDGAAGVGIGSEMSGGVRNVTISNCVFDGTGHGLHFKSMRGRGGVIEDITVSNIVMRNIIIHPAIHLNLKYWRPSDPEPISDRTPSIRNLKFSHIRGTNLLKAAEIVGLEERNIENITFDDVDLNAETGITTSLVDDLRLSNMRINAKSGPALSCELTSRLEINGLSRASVNTDTPAIVLKGVQSAALSRIAPFEKTGTVIAIDGKQTSDLRITDSHLKERPSSIAIGATVDPSTVKIGS